MTTALATPEFEDILDAARRLDGQAVRTPLLENAVLNERIGGRVLLKAEILQVSGSFKFRGAYNRISRFSAAEKAAGVVAYSSGNHAQGVAAAAERIGTRALIVMPADCPSVKIEGVKSFGGEVRLYDRWTESREAIGAEIARERGSVLVPPFDDFHVMAGQGTTGLEMVEQARALGAGLDVVCAPASGGGLVGGIALAMEALSPETQVFVAEPADYDDHARSLASGERTGHAPSPPPSICDALMAPMPGEVTWPANSRLLAGAAGVTDAEAADAMRFAFRTLKLVVEPGGAAALAALLSGKLPARDRTVAVVLSGGNVDPALFARVLAKEI
ncbi:MAG TPA: threonine/serine dehydratase [Caulobacteraceae bacterium]|nr:threonine/serine dehydratase [Caulobacteraceae bacterium]